MRLTRLIAAPVLVLLAACGAQSAAAPEPLTLHAGEPAAVAPAGDRFTDALTDHQAQLAREAAWYDVAYWRDVAAWVTALEAHRAPPVTHHNPPPPTERPAEGGSGRCGGSLPPCWVLTRESRGNIRAVNPGGCVVKNRAGVVTSRGCFGKWQFSGPTWNGYGGYDRADQAPESVQDDRAEQVWDGGRGCSNWAAC